MKLLMPQDEGRERRGVPGAAWPSDMQGAATPALGRPPRCPAGHAKVGKTEFLGSSGPQPS